MQGAKQPDMDIVAARIQSNAGLSLDPGKAHIKTVAGVEAVQRAAVELAELVAIDGVVEQIGEIIEQLHRRAHHIGAGLALAELARMRPIAGQAESAGGSAIGGIERAEPADDVLVDGALRHLIG